MKKLREIRTKLLVDMNEYILQWGDEDIQNAWFQAGLPDCPSDEDFELYAINDDEWVYICKLFYRLTAERRKI